MVNNECKWFNLSLLKVAPYCMNNIYVYQDDELRMNSAVPYLGFMLLAFTVNINNQPRIHFLVTYGHQRLLLWQQAIVA